jgi:hypothetical protein
MSSTVDMQKITNFFGNMTSHLHPIESYFITQLEEGNTPDLVSIGGIDAIFQQREALVKLPILEEILKVVVNNLDSSDRDQTENVTEFFNEAFLKNTHPITIREITHLLSQNVDVLTSCFKTLLKLSDDNTRPGILRRYYLAGAFEIALNSPAKKHTLIGYLLDADGTEDPSYITHLVKIIGLTFTFFEEEDLFIKLESLVECADYERIFELGMGSLHKALNANEQQESKMLFSQALNYFKQAEALGREDAANYRIALEIFYKFTNGGKAEDIENLAISLKNNIVTSLAWNPPDMFLSWSGLRHTELMHWNLLSEKIGTLVKHMDEPGWFEPSLIIEDYLLKIYSSSRTILNKKLGRGTDQIIQPLIKQRMAGQRTQVYLLDQWLKNKTDHQLWPIAEQLKQQIDHYKAKQPLGNELGTVALSSAVPAYTEIPKEEQSQFQIFASTFRELHSTSTPKVIVSTFETLCDQLQQIPSYNDPEIKLSFQTILYYSLYFLKLRMDNSKSNHPAMAYLFKGSTTPLESQLQQDYYTFMVTQQSIGDVRIEISDIASGRVDVLFNFLSYHICTEVKREFIDCSFQHLTTQYLGQAMEYGNTSAKFGILLVLDLTEKPHGMGSFESRVKLEIASAPAIQDTRGIIIMTVPGNRVTPSAVKKSNT